ncbi:MAG: hypothetical protein AB2A00_09105 [Myxococcota bacterium]
MTSQEGAQGGTADAVKLMVQRAEQRFQDMRMDVWRRTDRMFVALMLGQWVFAIAVALVFSPYAWEGKRQAVHLHVYVAVLLGGALSSLPVLLGLLRPGAATTRHVMAVAQMLWSALLIHLSGGRIETHFHVFGSLAFLAFYRDWTVLLTATVVVAGDHLVRGLAWPESVYGITNPEWWRFVEHAFWVVFENAFLVLSIRAQVREMRDASEYQAQIEALSESEWRRSSIVDREKPAAA